jgi:hypothetical protein
VNAPTYEKLPTELTALPRWCPWRFEGDRKIGYDLHTGQWAKSNDPATWASFPVALAAYRANPRYWRGLIFVLGDDAPYFGFDLDNCRNPDTGDIVPRAHRIIGQFSTYTEASQSGRGVKGIGRGVMPTPDGAGKNFRKDPWGTGTGGIEFYRRGRFWALTGWAVPGTPNTVNERTSELRSLYRELYPPELKRILPRIADISSVDDRSRAERCRKYVEQLQASISGQGGHDRLLAAACICWRFGLTDGSALSILHTFNFRCSPPWSDREIERKWSEAAKVSGSSTFGSMLTDAHRHVATPLHSRRSFLVTVGAL